MKQFNVAIVGAGPAGLAAAKELLTAGHKVDIYERENFGGGVMAFGIPSFRFKMDAIAKQVDPVVALLEEIRDELKADKAKAE